MRTSKPSCSFWAMAYIITSAMATAQEMSESRMSEKRGVCGRCVCAPWFIAVRMLRLGRLSENVCRQMSALGHKCGDWHVQGLAVACTGSCCGRS